jgi:MraZ protein
VFIGEYRGRVDEKGRIAVPSRFRAELEGGAVVSKWIDLCLALHSRPEWERLASRVEGLQVADPDARAFQRFIYASAFEVTLDGQGRLVLPGVLRTFALLGADAVVVGARNHVEIWSPARWETYSSQMDDPAVLAGPLEGLGI